MHEGTPNGQSLRNNDSLKLLIKGFHNINLPPRKLWPEWDLEVVLDALNTEPFHFQPVLSATLRNFTIKTAFLLVLTSSRRVSEIHVVGGGSYCLAPPQWGFPILQIVISSKNQKK